MDSLSIFRVTTRGKSFKFINAQTEGFSTAYHLSYRKSKWNRCGKQQEVSLCNHKTNEQRYLWRVKQVFLLFSAHLANLSSDKVFYQKLSCSANVRSDHRLEMLRNVHTNLTGPFAARITLLHLPKRATAVLCSRTGQIWPHKKHRVICCLSCWGGEGGRKGGREERMEEGAGKRHFVGRKGNKGPAPKVLFKLKCKLQAVEEKIGHTCIQGSGCRLKWSKRKGRRTPFPVLGSSSHGLWKGWFVYDQPTYQQALFLDWVTIVPPSKRFPEETKIKDVLNSPLMSHASCEKGILRSPSTSGMTPRVKQAQICFLHSLCWSFFWQS